MKHLFVPAVAVLLLAAPGARAFEPSENYKKREIQGFTVLVHPEVEKHADEVKVAFEELDSQLKTLSAVVPEKPLVALKKVKFWVEWQTKKNGAAEFHVSKGWLKDNGYNPEKAGGVEINNLKNFVDWSRRAQPWMVLHELAHAYHFLTLGDAYEPLESAYKQAIERKLYESVEYVGGGKKKAYATTNRAEYFAELSEAYFGKNDFAPYTRSELEKHDPVGFELMQKAWGTPTK
ncbi:hypothetical protein VT84_00640 [Gemmata sp. SH-PL17]|uniref:hypothetical protein n=1 Tax=Gemmata sp. SH-PL17 TaxID=1630693 RepID=UPI00078C20AC|nr:hypothetical protein [Gemmata sp. SH-PL17]AMV22885.1 hypothetical protein VT84_00640 [Gemmata sp. SH-PL17]